MSEKPSRTGRKRRIRTILIGLAAVAALWLAAAAGNGGTAWAASDTLLPTPCDNLNIDLRSSSALVPTDSGYMRVFFDGERIRVENYDSALNY